MSHCSSVDALICTAIDSQKNTHPRCAYKDPTRNASPNNNCIGGSSEPDLSLYHSLSPVYKQLISEMLQSHIAGRDLCLIAPRGAGKTFVVNCFGLVCGYSPIEVLFLYKDMSARDLLQRRTTSDRGETIWQDTPLVSALRHGRLAVLDGIHRLPAGTVGILLRLVADREITLFDGTRFVRHDRYLRMQTEYSLTREQLDQRRILPIHPAFRLIVTAVPPDAATPWLNNEVMQMFVFHSMNAMLSAQPTVASTALAATAIASLPVPQIDIATLLSTIVPGFPIQLCRKLQAFAQRTQELHIDPMVQLEEPVSLRQLIRIARRSVVHRNELHSCVASTCMLRFMPPAKRQAMLDAMRESGLLDDGDDSAPLSFGSAWAHQEQGVPIVQINERLLRIGSTQVEIHAPTHPELVPDIVFFEIPRHTVILEAMLKDYLLGEHLLLVGNQGVGKNKVCMRECM
jgi:von Willebrand factor A domain-containing protein 8